jgi:hypothetical protein
MVVVETEPEKDASGEKWGADRQLPRGESVMCDDVISKVLWLRLTHTRAS